MKKCIAEAAQTVLFVGAFPPAGRKVFGGNVTDCKLLLNSSFSKQTKLILLDSTQISNPAPSFPIRLIFAIKRFILYLIKIERHRPDAVLLFMSSGISVFEKGIMAWYAFLRGTPALLFPRGGALIDQCNASFFTRLWVRMVLKGGNKILCQGLTWHKFAVNLMKFSPEHAPIINSWAATPAFLAVGRQRSFERNSKPVRLLFVGRLEKKKGIFELLNSYRHLSKSRAVELIIVGEGNASESARRIVSKYGLDDRVNFCGWLVGSELERVYAEADIFVLPSWAEGLPNVMIEAMAAKLAVVISEVGNIPDVVKDGKEALLVSPRNKTALQLALTKVIDNAKLRRHMGEAAFSLAEELWGVEKAIDALLLAIRLSVKQKNNNIA
ncbi:MAG: glycosyltransferase family 1 protein [Candidatus Electrothrix sp. AR4]|nr:glycosyltransferase family 1 protein [Candidatus Electrothrix sp. AR4]